MYRYQKMKKNNISISKNEEKQYIDY